MGTIAARSSRLLLSTLSARGIDPRVVAAMGAVPREEFVPDAAKDSAYEDGPLPIGLGQTISQPSLVAKMTELLRIHRFSRVLEVGTGCGYQTAILAELASQVYSIELEEELLADATARLRRLGYRNVEARAADGYLGWPDRAPFDAIVVTASASNVPPALVEQLRGGGRMVIPVRDELLLVTKDESGAVAQKKLGRVSFVPLRREPMR